MGSPVNVSDMASVRRRTNQAATRVLAGITVIAANPTPSRP